jgi:hypothetical protein
LLAGDAGVGKTWLTLGLALDVATGRSWLGQFPVKRGSVLVVDEENADLLLRVRLAAMLKARNLHPDGIPISFLVGAGVNLSPIYHPKTGALQSTQGYVKLLNTVAECRPALVIFDSLTRCHRSNENSANEMAAVFANVRHLVNQTGCSVLFTHHFRKAGANSSGSGQAIRGSSDIRAFCDYTLLAERTETGIKITHDKSRWSQLVDPFAVKLAYTDDSFDLVWDGERPAVGLRTIWDWLRGTLTEGASTRAQLIDRAQETEICKQRKLDDTLRWRTKHGFLEKVKIGREVGYRLTDKEVLTDQIDLTELEDV